MFTDPKELCQRFFDEVATGGNLDAIDELIAEDVIEHEETPGLEPNREGVRAFFRMLHAGFPDMRAEIEQMVAEGDTVSVRSRWRGTHDGEFMGIPATGRSVDIEVMDMIRVANDRVAEHWGIADMMAMMQQLGVVEEAPTASA